MLPGRARKCLQDFIPLFIVKFAFKALSYLNSKLTGWFDMPVTNMHFEIAKWGEDCSNAGEMPKGITTAYVRISQLNSEIFFQVEENKKSLSEIVFY